MAQSELSLQESPSGLDTQPTKSSLWRRLLGRSSNGAVSPAESLKALPPPPPAPEPEPDMHLDHGGPEPKPRPEEEEQEGDQQEEPKGQQQDELTGEHGEGDEEEDDDGDGDGEAKTGPHRRVSRQVVPGLPRAQTFQRQQSEMRNNLEPFKPTVAERRALSVDRRMHSSQNSSQLISNPRTSAPDFLMSAYNGTPSFSSVPPSPVDEHMLDSIGELTSHDGLTDEPGEVPPHVPDTASQVDTASMTTSQYDLMIHDELERRWILNLSMRFRDKSKREKFFVTYRETESLWRRVTISLDYRSAPDNSLEWDLIHTKFQRDKNAKIYEAIRESLVDIQFYDTVTNLKLQTTDGRLHVHVVEDVNEIIHYPTTRMIQHLRCRRVKERDIVFDSHMSGFVYKVRVDDVMLIKKEIPGPDTVDEFLYEVNALNQLRHSSNVIQFYGVIVDDQDEVVKGLLISFAEQGALIDIIYDNDHSLPWSTREKWARQIIEGLSEIHEAGFVQGDFTLSNIVIDNNDNAKIIDINRRGCPVGWEPPEATPLIESNQRISMYIGVKSDLYQLGMVLWALAMQEDEPESHGRPLLLDPEADVPDWFRTIVETCLAEDPRLRAQAIHLLGMFPDPEEAADDWAERDLPSITVDDGASMQEYFVDGYHPNGRPRIRTVQPPNGWSRANSGHPYDNPGAGLPNDPYHHHYYYPTRGRSPPSHLPSNYDNSPRRTSAWSGYSYGQDHETSSVSDMAADEHVSEGKRSVTPVSGKGSVPATGETQVDETAQVGGTFDEGNAAEPPAREVNKLHLEGTEEADEHGGASLIPKATDNAAAEQHILVPIAESLSPDEGESTPTPDEAAHQIGSSTPEAEDNDKDPTPTPGDLDLEASSPPREPSSPEHGKPTTVADNLPEADSTILKANGAAFKADETASDRTGLASDANDAIPEVDNSAHESTSPSSQTDNPTQATSDAPPEANSSTPEAHDLTHGTSDAPPETADMPPAPADSSLEAATPSLAAEDATPDTTDTISVSGTLPSATPKADEPPPKAGDVTPQADDLTPHIDLMPPAANTEARGQMGHSEVQEPAEDRPDAPEFPTPVEPAHEPEAGVAEAGPRPQPEPEPELEPEPIEKEAPTTPALALDSKSHDADRRPEMTELEPPELEPESATNEAEVGALVPDQTADKIDTMDSDGTRQADIHPLPAERRSGETAPGYGTCGTARDDDRTRQASRREDGDGLQSVRQAGNAVEDIGTDGGDEDKADSAGEARQPGSEPQPERGTGREPERQQQQQQKSDPEEEGRVPRTASAPSRPRGSPTLALPDELKGVGAAYDETHEHGGSGLDFGVADLSIDDELDALATTVMTKHEHT